MPLHQHGYVTPDSRTTLGRSLLVAALTFRAAMVIVTVYPSYRRGTSVHLIQGRSYRAFVASVVPYGVATDEVRMSIRDSTTRPPRCLSFVLLLISLPHHLTLQPSLFNAVLLSQPRLESALDSNHSVPLPRPNLPGAPCSLVPIASITPNISKHERKNK